MTQVSWLQTRVCCICVGFWLQNRVCRTVVGRPCLPEQLCDEGMVHNGVAGSLCCS